MKIKTKEVSRLSRKIGSAMLAGVLAMGMCVPAMSVAMLNSPEHAVAADSVAISASQFPIDVDELVEFFQNHVGDTLEHSCSQFNTITGVEGYKVKTNNDLMTFDLSSETDRSCFEVLHCSHSAAAPAELTRALSVFKDTPDDGIDVALNDASVDLTYAMAQKMGDYSLSVGDKKTTENIGPEDSKTLSVDVADLAAGTYAVAAGIEGGDTDIEGTLTVSEAGKVSISLTSTEGTAKETSYSVFKIFDADVDGKIDDTTAPKGSNVEFATGVTGDIIKGTSDDTRDFSVAQNAAEFINENIAHQPGVGLNAGSYGTELAKRLMAAGLTPIAVTADAEAAIELAGEGYYLIVKTDDLTGENTVASSPIYVALDEGVSTIKLKSAIPTVTKQIKEDSTGEWGITADSSLGQAVDYKITGTVAENVAAYDTYAYKFVDTLEAGKLAVDTASVNVTVDGKDVTAQATVKYEGDVLTVEFADLKALTDGADKIVITPDTAVVLTYTASIVAASDVAGDGNENGVVLHYANNPVFDSMGYTKESKVRDFTYALNLNKVDHKTAAPMKDVEFSFKNSAGKFLNADGSESDTEVFIKTDDEGKINITHIDADTYTVAEKTPDGYRDLAEFTVTIAPTYGDDEAAPTLQKVTALDGNFNAEVDTTYVNNLTKDADAGLVDWTVRNVKYVDLPITGEEGIFLLTLLGITLVAGGVTISVLRRKEQF